MAVVDVLMPAYNAAETIYESIESLRAQTLQDIRIIVVDDGSTDRTPEILAGLAAKDARVVAVTTPNAGIVDARNTSLRHAQADIVACLDSDDIAYPDRLERTLAFLNAHPDCVAVGGAVDHIDSEGRAIAGLQQPGDPALADPRKAPALEPYMIHSTVMARRANIVAVGGYRPMPSAEDSDLFWRLSERGRLVNLPDKLGKYRVHTASASSSLRGGRVMAVASQLGALSAVRRQAGSADIEFSRALHEALNQAATLADMATVASRGLNDGETRHLHIATACKFMELARYRPFEPERADCDFIRAALPFAAELSEQNQREVAWYATVTGARLVRKGMVTEAFALMQPKHYPVAMARALRG